MTLVYAHRGFSEAFPENTLLAFQEAIAAGVDGIEFDVRSTADGVPVVIHDRDVARTTDGTGRVDELTLARLRTFDAGRGERVPTLDEALRVIGDAAHLDVEIKRSGIEGAVLGVLAEHPRTHWAISSFDWDVLRRIRRRDREAELWPLAERCDDALLAVAAEIDAPGVALLSDAYSEESAVRLREAGLGAMVWTVNDAVEARRVQALGAAVLCTDDPLLILRAFGS